MRYTPVDDMSCAYSRLQSGQHGLHLGDHAFRDLPLLRQFRDVGGGAFRDEAILIAKFAA